MEAQIKALREKAATAHEQAKSLMKEFEGKAMPPEKEKQVDEWLNEVDTLIAQANRQEKALELDKRLNAPATRLPTPQTGEGKGGKAVEPSDHEKAFDKALRNGTNGLNEGERKALRLDDDQAGGFLAAPQTFAQGLLKFVDDAVYVRQLATVNQIGAAESLGVLSLDSDLADWDWTTELATGSEDSVKPFGKRALTPHPLAKRIKISNTLIRKSVRPVETLVQERASYKLGVTLEKAYMTGDGAQKALGLFTLSTDGIPTGRDVTYTDTNDTTRSDSIINAKYSLKAQYQSSPTTRWIFSREAVKRVRKFRDANGQFMWNPGLGLVQGEPGAPTLLETPVLMSEFAPATFSSGLYVGLIGDLRYYWIVDALNMQMQVLNELYAETNQRGYIFRYEGDGAPMLAEAFARLIHA